jgi:hypothetical protein
MHINKELHIPKSTYKRTFAHTPNTGQSDWSQDIVDIDYAQDDDWYIYDSKEPFCKAHTKKKFVPTQFGYVNTTPTQVYLNAEGEREPLSTFDKVGLVSIGLIMVITSGIILLKR